MIENKNNNELSTIKDCFDLILSGEKEESRLAARKVRKLLYGSNSGRDVYDDIKNIINSAPANYLIISEEWRQENFVSAVSVIYYLHNREAEPDFLFPWLFHLLLHPKGNIRYAAVRMLTTEIGPLTVHLRFPGSKSDRLSPKKAELVLRLLFLNLNSMLASLWEPKYKKYKYVESLPACSYKSVLMVLVELEDSCKKEFN